MYYICAERDQYNARNDMGWEPRTWIDIDPDPESYPYNMGARILDGPYDSEEEAQKAIDEADWSIANPFFD